LRSPHAALPPTLPLHAALPISAVPQLRAIPIPSVERAVLRSIALGRNGTLWLGTDNAGVIRFEPAGENAGRVRRIPFAGGDPARSEEHTSELQSRENLVCRLLL